MSQKRDMGHPAKALLISERYRGLKPAATPWLLGDAMSEYEKLVLEDLCVLKAQMQQLLGIGQPGRLHQLETRVESHERSVQRLKGLAGALGGLITLVHVAIDYAGRK